MWAGGALRDAAASNAGDSSGPAATCMYRNVFGQWWLKFYKPSISETSPKDNITRRQNNRQYLA